jgi:hypothetical protein
LLSLAAWQDFRIGLAWCCTGIPYNASYADRDRNSDLPEAERVWSEAGRFGFITWIAANPDAGDVISGADGARKVRWKRAGTGKSGGARVMYFNLTDEEIVLPVAVYAKAERENMLPKDIRKVV